MTVAIYVASESDATCLIPWGLKFAQADHTELLIVCPKKSKGKRAKDPLKLSEKDDSPLYGAVFDVLGKLESDRFVLKEQIAEGESSSLDRVAIETQELIAPDPEAAFVEEISKSDVWTLVLPAFEPTKSTNPAEMPWAQNLFLNAPCQTAIVRGSPPGDSSTRILVACQGEASNDDQVAINRACQLAKLAGEESISLLYVRPDDDVVARDVGLRHIDQLKKGVSESKVEIRGRVMLSDSFSDGIKRSPLKRYDLLIVGTRSRKTLVTLDRGIQQGDGDKKTAIMAVREAVPFTNKMWRRFRHAIRRRVPQLDREHRVSLVDRLNESSEFNFDFVALISLSTLIAALGLARNSPAVVIGAMLVAPLMTPLVAMGFALVQGNERLVRSAMKSLVLGFTVAVAIGAAVGLVIRLVAPHLPISPQMLERGSPNLLDLVVALASGVAGAYAMGRKNLNSAIPGVAIAVALVPPIATAGLALSMNSLTLFGGASLLFLTNIVAIVLGTAMTFWAVGISTRVEGDRPPQVWPRYLFLGFVIISFLLAAIMSVLNPLDPAP